MEFRSFAYKTIKDRLPVIVTKTIDYISRHRSELLTKYTQESDEDIKLVIESLSCLRYELQTDKPYKLLLDQGEDVEIWNNTIKELQATLGEDNCTWFKGPWLFGECYLYRRIREAMLSCKTDMKNYDPFEKSKLESCLAAQQSVSKLIRGLSLLEEHKDEEQSWKNFHNIVQALLWSNKNDLSLSSGQAVTEKVSDLINMLESFEANILCNHIESLWEFLNDLKSERIASQKHVRIDIVLDNCGIELASDLILSDFLLRHDFVDEIVLHGKAFPWFISDVTESDFEYLLVQFQSENSIHTNQFHRRLRNYLDVGRLKLTVDPFWTLSHSYDQMNRVSPDLYTELQRKSSLVILKGKLVLFHLLINIF